MKTYGSEHIGTQDHQEERRKIEQMKGGSEKKFQEIDQEKQNVKKGHAVQDQKSEKKFMNNYYPRVRELREDHDLTQRQIAKILGMTQAMYWRYEKGYRDLPTDVLIRIARMFNVTTDYVLGVDDWPYRDRTNRPKEPKK